MKVWNTMTAALMTDPGALAGGDHTIPLCGNDADAKAEVTAILESFGWRDILDLGDITAARAMEAHLLIWLRELGALDTGDVQHEGGALTASLRRRGGSRRDRRRAPAEAVPSRRTAAACIVADPSPAATA